MNAGLLSLPLWYFLVATMEALVRIWYSMEVLGNLLDATAVHS